MKFNYRLLTHTPERLNVISTKLGDANDAYTQADVGKPMVFNGVGSMKIATDGAEIEGFLDNIDPGPTADLCVMGGVARANRGARFQARVLIAQDSTLNLYSYVVAGVSTGIGTPSVDGLPMVKPSGSGGATVTGWRIIALEGDVASITEPDVENIYATCIIERQ